MNALFLLLATLAVFTPLFLAGFRKYTGRKARRALWSNIVSFCAMFVLATVLGFTGSASAAGAEGLGFLPASLEECAPHDTVTREEAAAMLYQFLAYSGILVPVAQS